MAQEREGVPCHPHVWHGTLSTGFTRVSYLKESCVYKVDMSGIEPGHVFDVGQLESMFGISASSREYPLHAVKFAKWAQGALWREGKRYTLCLRKDSVVVLTWSEASAYNASHFDGYVRRARERERCMRAVDVSCLTFEEQEDHRRDLTMMAVQAQAVRTVRKIYLVEHRGEFPLTPMG